MDFNITPRKGWLFYQGNTGLNNANGWMFRAYRADAAVVRTAGVDLALDPAQWYHLVGVYDGANVKLYVNGALAASTPMGGPYAPTTPIIPLTFGSRADGASGNYGWGGDIDEAAYYGAALSDARILAHYQAGSSLAPTTPYSQVVLADSPLGYWRMNEPYYTAPDPSTYPVAANSGTAGDALVGLYNLGMEFTAGPAYTGFGANNRAGRLWSVVSGGVGTAATLNDLAQFTMMGWIQRGVGHSTRGGYFGQNDLIEFGDADSGTNIELWSSAGGQIKIPYPFKDNDWGFLALVGDGTKMTLYANGVPVASRPATVTTYGNSGYFFNIAGGGIFNATGDFFYGNVDEVAIFDKALTDQQIMDLFLSANVPPWITRQPAAPARDIFAGNIVTLSVVADGNPPLSYQWRKGDVELIGQTSTTLAFDSITEADSGVYDVVIRNNYGSIASAKVTLAVKPAETNPPTILHAAGNQTFNAVRVWFSEPLDPVSAQKAENYKLSGELVVSSATLSAPAGNPGDNIVDLVTSMQTPGQVYTLTVNDVKDQVFPANTIAAGTAVQFSSCMLSPGVLRFEVWNGLSTSDNSIVNTLLSDPRFPGSPDAVTFTTAFSSRPVYPTDSHEGYGGKMSGLLVPTKTADYRFFLASDDSSRLYLSTNADAANKTLIAEEVGCCVGFLQPDPAQGDAWHNNGAGMGQTTLTPIHLVAGQQYYIEAIWKEGTGGDYCNVAWREETDATPANQLSSIPGQYLATVVDPNVDMAFAQQPVSQIGTPASTAVEISSQNFSAGDGGYTVINTDPAPPGPWYWNGTTWLADGGESDCTGPYNSQLNSPTNTLSQNGTLMLTFNHRYSFEPDLWDAGQVRVSVNGGAFTLVPAQNFITNGYAEGLIVGNGIAKDQRAFNANSPGYASGAFITSKAILGTFTTNDQVVVQFVGAWDDCATASAPSWEIQSVKLDLMVGAEPSTFTAEAVAQRRGEPVELRYQWQRHDGAGWVNIPEATTASFQITPTPVDMNASFRLVVTAYGIPGKVIYSDVVKLAATPTISISRSDTGIAVSYIGTLESATAVDGAFTPVQGAQNPHLIANPTGTMFFRSVK